MMEESYLIFSGRRWRVLHVDMEHKRIELARATGGRARVSAVRQVQYTTRYGTRCSSFTGSSALPAYLDAEAKELMMEGRHHFHEMALQEASLLKDGRDTLIFPWAGDIAMDTLAAILTNRGTQAEREGVCVTVKDTAEPRGTCEAARYKEMGHLHPRWSWLPESRNKQSEKYDEYLDEDLLSLDWASRRLDTQGALLVAERLTHDER
ncbi:MAG: hypothetical protein U5K43_15790 [Halofilum sp. (in: g-proteobacteria)]|nr:hypothetical protein [Halofilum sp. (in: g-proteobacteria)]